MIECEEKTSYVVVRVYADGKLDSDWVEFDTAEKAVRHMNLITNSLTEEEAEQYRNFYVDKVTWLEGMI